PAYRSCCIAATRYHSIRVKFADDLITLYQAGTQLYGKEQIFNSKTPMKTTYPDIRNIVSGAGHYFPFQMVFCTYHSDLNVSAFSPECISNSNGRIYVTTGAAGCNKRFCAMPGMDTLLNL